MQMHKTLRLAMGILIASQTLSTSVFAAVSDLQKAADTAQAAARASADGAYTLSGTTYDNNSGAPGTPVATAATISTSKQPSHSLGIVSKQSATGQRRVRAPHLASKPSKSAGEGAAVGGGVGFVAGFMTGFTVCMIPAAIISHVPLVGKIVGGIVAIPSAVIGIVVGLFTGAIGAMAGAAAGGVVGGVGG